MSKKIDRLVIAARKAAEESETAQRELGDARRAHIEAEHRYADARGAKERADWALIEAVRES